MLRIIIGANSNIDITPKIIEALKERKIEFILELDLLSRSYIELELDNKIIILQSENDLMRFLDNLNDRKGDDSSNGSLTYTSDNVLSNLSLV
ncbi:hypothetical protein [Sulfurisphaera tokodaii]|uniref:Uncharacterized protein n=2 Tax=Sulfurisphaera tokodaii TaxID=111955 RepID=F9VMP1_SULTO|nr:hypothetical protein [Sulfurisphaera tokodaii]BAK54187.1 hypothetical protein STK_02014 [Sulfurisphaera tokodaii str. 7]HII74320.1 hypothetical protein [Sulfurisphaera tokodaii]